MGFGAIKPFIDQLDLVDLCPNLQMLNSVMFFVDKHHNGSFKRDIKALHQLQMALLVTDVSLLHFSTCKMKFI